MNDLQTTDLGTLNSYSKTATPSQITTYINSIISVQTVALGGNDEDHANINTKAKDKGVVIGYNAVTEDDSTVVVVGNGAKAKDWGTAIGHQSYSNLGVAFGADAIALSGHSIALGRFSYASADYAVQINGDKTTAGYVDKAINKEAHTLKFYNGSTNTTIVRADGTISADNAYAADTLKTTHTIGGQNFNGSQDVVLSASQTEADNGTATDKLITPSTTAGAVKNALIHNANGTAGGTSLASTDQFSVQSWLGTNQLTFVFNDGTTSTTRTFNFVCNEVIS